MDKGSDRDRPETMEYLRAETGHTQDKGVMGGIEGDQVKCTNESASGQVIKMSCPGVRPY